MRQVFYQEGLANGLHHSALDAGFTQDVVGGDTCLTAVDKLSPCDPPVEKVSHLP